MAFESMKFAKIRESFQPEQSDVELLHQSVEFMLPPQSVLRNNPDKKFLLKTNGANTWPNITIQPENEENNREVYISLNGLPQKLFFSYFLTPEDKIISDPEDFTNFSESDRKVYEDKCFNIRRSLEEAEIRDVYQGWDAIPN
jgi:hypothetical protein